MLKIVERLPTLSGPALLQLYGNTIDCIYLKNAKYDDATYLLGKIELEFERRKTKGLFLYIGGSLPKVGMLKTVG
ncbi:MAG: hypothetical protein WD673_03070 [Alphaproteobacteria bacterium]